MRYVCTVAIVTIMAMTACSPISVKTDYDRSIDFSDFKTYRWASAEEMNPDDVLAKNPLTQRRIKSSVDKVLSERGFVKQDSGAVDFVVMIHAGVQEKVQVTDWGYRGWYDPWWGPYGGRVDVSYYDEGTLVVDIVDMPEKELAWRGLGTGIVPEIDDPEEQQEKWNEIIARIMKNFPPSK